MNRGRATSLVAVVTLLLSATAAGAVAAPTTKLLAQDSQPTFSDEDVRAAEIADYVETAGGLGVYYDFDRTEMVVVLPASGSDTFSVLSAEAIGMPFRVEKRPIELAEVREIESQLLDGTFTKERLRGPYGFFFDPQLGTVRIEASGPASAFAALRQKYPAMTSYAETFPQRLTRQDDIAPHFGGSYIRGQVHQNPCTSGFTVKNAAGTRFMVTTGHCWPQGEVVFGGTGSPVNWGTVVNKAPFPVWDMELIGGKTYGLDIYTGLATGTPTLVKAAGDPVVGPTNYCHSGSFSFEGCGHHVTSLNANYCDDQGFCTAGVIAFHEGLPPELGDSGAPFYNYTTGGVTIRGLLLGGGQGGFYYAERWTSVSGHFGVSIVHG